MDPCDRLSPEDWAVMDGARREYERKYAEDAARENVRVSQDRYREGLARFMTRLCRKYGIRNGSGADEEDDTPAIETGLLNDAQLALAL